MDAFILAFRNLCDQIMPILSAIVLVCLIILLIKLIKVLTNVNNTLLKTHTTIDLVDKSIEKVQSPLDTVVKVSGTVDKAHDATISAVKEATDYVSAHAGEIKDKVTKFVNEVTTSDKKAIDEYKEPSPEDLIGG